MGNGDNGQLGNGTFTYTNRPQNIVASGVTGVAGGGSHSLFLMSDGSLWAMGNNSFGQLGDGTIYTVTNRPKQIVGSGVAAIAAGNDYSLFLKADGSLWGMGSNLYGPLGDGGTTTLLPEPTLIVASNVTAIAAGGGHTLFLKSDGSLWALGYNYYGQLGDGMGSVYNQSTNKPQKILAGGVMAIAAGGAHSLFLKSDGSLWGMGYGYWGQLGDEVGYQTNRPVEIVSSNVTAIAAGGSHSAFLKSDGSLWTMGHNAYGQLGNGTLNETNQPQEIVTGNVTSVTLGSDYSLFLQTDGSLWAMGNNRLGQLGDGFIDDVYPTGVPVPERIYPPPQPVLAIAIAGADLQFTATCPFGGDFHLLTSTNLALPLYDWIPVWTNSVFLRGTNNFTATLTNAVNPGGRQFYTLQAP